MSHADGDDQRPGCRAQPAQRQPVLVRDHVVHHVVDDHHGTPDPADAAGTVEPVDARQPLETSPGAPAGGRQRRLQHDSRELSPTGGRLRRPERRRNPVRGQFDARHGAQTKAVQQRSRLPMTVPFTQHFHGGFGVRVEVQFGRAARAQPVTGIVVAQYVAAQPAQNRHIGLG